MTISKLLETKEVIFFDLFHTLISTIDNQDFFIYEYDYLNIDRDIWNQTSMSQYHDRGLGIVNKPYEITKNIAHAIDKTITHEQLLKATEYRINRVGIALTKIDSENEAVLKNLKAKGYKLGLISNADVIDIMSWSQSPFAKYFDDVIFSCEVGIAKPDRRIYELAMSHFDVKPDLCVFVGDGGSNELSMAKELGITTILTTQYRRLLWPDTLEALKKDSDYVIDHINELNDF